MAEIIEGQGKRGRGRPVKEFDLSKAIELRKAGMGYLGIAEKVGCSVGLVYREMPKKYRGVYDAFMDQWGPLKGKKRGRKKKLSRVLSIVRRGEKGEQLVST